MILMRFTKEPKPCRQARYYWSVSPLSCSVPFVLCGPLDWVIRSERSFRSATPLGSTTTQSRPNSVSLLYSEVTALTAFAS